MQFRTLYQPHIPVLLESTGRARTAGMKKPRTVRTSLAQQVAGLAWASRMDHRPKKAGMGMVSGVPRAMKRADAKLRKF